MSEFAITQEVDGSKGRNILRHDGVEAELTYSIASDYLAIADHTAVPDSLRGTGAGLALVTRMVSDARKSSVKIAPLCPFVNAQRRKHPDWTDALNV